MQLINAPAKLVLPFANAGAKNTIPTASQIGIVAGAASLVDGFPPLTRTPLAAGGVPPSGLDMNGILYELSAVIRWANAGGGYPYDASFATDTNIQGYPKGSRVLRSDGSGYWFNTTDGNTTDPEGAGAIAAGWVPDFTTGAAAVTMTSANVTLTAAQYGKPIIVITGLLTANLNLIFPSIVGEWIVINSTTGPYTITCKTAAGTGVVVNSVQALAGDATNIYSAVNDAISSMGELIASAGGTADALTVALSPAWRAWQNGVPFFVRAASANATTTPTVAVGALAAKTLVKGSNAALVAGDVAGAGHWLLMQYDVTLDKVVLLNPATGIASASTRIRLSANTTFYVATTGNNSNTGLTVGAPWLTIQKAIDVISQQYDLAGFTATISVANGTYAGNVVVAAPFVGGGLVVLQGNAATPASCVISASANCIDLSGNATLTIGGFKLTTSSGNNISSVNGSQVFVTGLMEFGTTPGSDFVASQRGQISVSANYTISGNAGTHFNTTLGGMIVTSGRTVTLTGTPAFGGAFVSATDASIVQCTGFTFTGSATGSRYSVSGNSVIETNGGGATYFPGSIAGSSATGGQYI